MSSDAQDAPNYPLLDSPADGLPPVVTDERELDDVVRALENGTGPVAVDAERAAGFRYSNRAYLVQLRREGAGTHLIDTDALPDLTPVHDALGDTEWVLHAATQDLPCLRELGMRPTRLFDTELGSRIAGLPRVGLAAVVEHYLQVTLAKEHSAVDWSTRPLPEPWLRYAALDVEVLVQVRDLLAADLEQQGKAEIAAQEFDALTRFTGPPQREDPWRRTSGIHRVRNRRAIGRLRELWETRDAIARSTDTAPGRVLQDAWLVEIAAVGPRNPESLRQVRPAKWPAKRRPPKGLDRHRAKWLAAVEAANQLDEKELPKPAGRSDGPPPARAWAERDPLAAARLEQVRNELSEHSEKSGIPVENLLTPDLLRRTLWGAGERVDEAAVRRELEAGGARPWQVDLVVPLIVAADSPRSVTDE